MLYNQPRTIEEVFAEAANDTLHKKEVK